MNKTLWCPSVGECHPKRASPWPQAERSSTEILRREPRTDSPSGTSAHPAQARAPRATIRIPMKNTMIESPSRKAAWRSGPRKLPNGSSQGPHRVWEINATHLGIQMDLVRNTVTNQAPASNSGQGPPSVPPTINPMITTRDVSEKKVPLRTLSERLRRGAGLRLADARVLSPSHQPGPPPSTSSSQRLA